VARQRLGPLSEMPTFLPLSRLDRHGRPKEREAHSVQWTGTGRCCGARKADSGCWSTSECAVIRARIGVACQC
jgi:hypothetical protein